MINLENSKEINLIEMCIKVLRQFFAEAKLEDP